MSRIPLVATVVGALLVGGATTGGTFASWTYQRPLHANGVQSGQLSFTATSPGAVAVEQTAGNTAESTFVLDDTSTGKNNQQRITASIVGTPAGITAKIGTSCATATSASVAVDTTPTSANQTLCVKVTSSTTAVSGDVTVSLSGAQLPTGWSTPTSIVSLPVHVAAGMVLSCAESQKDPARIRVTWGDIGAGSYTVYRAENTDGPWTPRAVVAGTSYTETEWSNSQRSFFKVEPLINPFAVTSNVLSVKRNGNSHNFECAP